MFMTQFAKKIDHYGAIRRENLGDDDVREEIEVAKKHNVRSVAVRPDCMKLAREVLEGSSVLVCAVIGFPFTDDETLAGRFNMAIRAIEDGADEIDLIPCRYHIIRRSWADYYWEISNIYAIVAQRGKVMNVVFEDEKLTNKLRKEVADACREIGVPCCGHWPGTCEKLEEARNLDRRRIARHVQAIRKGLRGEGRTKAVCCLYNLGDAIFYFTTGTHRIGTCETSMLMNEVEYWCDTQEGPYEYQVKAVKYRIQFKRDQ